MEKKYKVFYQGSLYGHFGRDRAEPEKPRGIIAPCGKAASAIGIIGGADGPTVIVTSSASGRTACSSLYYEPEYEPDWCMVFYNKPKEDIEIELI